MDVLKLLDKKIKMYMRICISYQEGFCNLPQVRQFTRLLSDEKYLYFDVLSCEEEADYFFINDFCKLKEITAISKLTLINDDLKAFQIDRSSGFYSRMIS
jgi:hypothetical protein